MDFETFTQYAKQLEEESSDNEKVSLVSELFLETTDEDIEIVARFIQGKLFPEWDDTKVKIGPATMYDALAEATKSSREEIEEIVADVGGIGEACDLLEFAGDGKGQQKLPALGEPQKLTVSEIYDTILEISEISGEGSKERKTKTLSNIVLDCETSDEAKYLTRLILGEMRIGVGEGTVRDGIASAFDMDTAVIQQGIMVRNDIGEIARLARDGTEKDISELTVTLGRPVQSMLAQSSEIQTAIEDCISDSETNAVIAEYKYDGSRLQIHKDGSRVQLFTRNCEEVTDSLPDIVETVRENVPEKKVILDAEVVAYELEDDGSLGDPKPFQEVMRRVGRKYDVDEMADEIHVDIQIFDILYRENRELINENLVSRKQELDAVCDEQQLAPYEMVSETDALREMKAASIQDGNEGLMVKNPDSVYSPGNRGKNWLKLKQDAEPLDCVVIGGEWGEGRRANFVGTYLLAVRSEDGSLQSIGKVATGITDEQLEELTNLLEDKIISEEGKELKFKPEVVFEVEYEDIQPSPTYESGYALRFPTFLRVRDEKDVSSADTVERVKNLA